MTLTECYECMEADYGDVIRRLGNEERVKRFLTRIPQDESYGNLCRALEAGDGAEAFRAAHSLKGICMNLGLTGLLNVVEELTEDLRGNQITDRTEDLFKQVQERYTRVTENIRLLMQ